ncbi:hypothetical protein NA56DRAFT_686012 [Hyaloscypha hepaticicola]|uniref:Cyclase n=1 Tax=Hyaloscypha hepaticicola TaxID=2082293 RepID=A0A2J6QGM8_9HELO|nr:hypothetical protein NA56DRAFT_686012 [Hyaloscypha hepaticicola]
MSLQTPPFSSLPLKKDGPRGNAWGLFGPTDELGMLNRLTPETTLAASKEIVHGVRVSTDWALDQPKVPGFGRAKFEHTIKHKHPRTVNDDEVKFNTQSSTQWDGFRHFGYQDHKIYFNGCTQDQIQNSNRNGIHIWVENGGVVGRGVLLDYKGWAESQGLEPALLEITEITVEQLNAIAAAQGVNFQPGDILFVHSGFVKALEALQGEDAKNYAANPPPTAIGVKSGEEMVKWIWEKQFAAVAGDMLAFEALPFQSTTHLLHEWLLAGWGMPIGELFDLEKLATECRRLNKWSFFFSSIPLKVPGGVASPPNSVAIL